MSADWTLGPAIRLRCPNVKCELHGQPEIIRPMRFGNVLMMGVWRCAKCLFEMEVVNRAIRQPEVTAILAEANAPVAPRTSAQKVAAHPRARKVLKPRAR